MQTRIFCLFKVGGIGQNYQICCFCLKKNRMTVHKDVRSICQETAHCLGLEIQVHAMELIAELVWKKMHVMGTDLECFAK